MAEILAEYRYFCKRSAANGGLGHRKGVGRPRKQRQHKPPLTSLHALFVRRVNEELAAKKLNATNLQEYGAVQRTLWDVLNTATDPRLSTLYRTATALGMEPHQLLRERERQESKQVSGNVAQFPSRPEIVPTNEGEPVSPRKLADRKKKRR
jgi:hypothetical protein